MISKQRNMCRALVVGAILIVATFGVDNSPAFAQGEGKNESKNYVNWANGYYFEIPADWRKIERFNVEEFLRLHGKDPVSVPHDAFFCPIDADPFWSKAYLFVTTEKSENSFAMADSLLLGMASEFDKMVKAEDTLGPITRLNSQKPRLDSKAQTITQVSKLNVQGGEQVMHLVMKFHKTGITTFYFYSQASLYQDFEPTFTQMLNSFSDEDLAEAEAGDKVSIVNVSESGANSAAVGQSTEQSSGESGKGFFDRYGSYVGFVFALIAYIAYIRYRRRHGGG